MQRPHYRSRIVLKAGAQSLNMVDVLKAMIKAYEIQGALALVAERGEMGYPSALSAPIWGFQDVSFEGKSLQNSQGFGTYVMENVLFKISYPAEFHPQTAVEAAAQLHPEVAGRLDAIDRIVIETQTSADRIINKTGPLANSADRDHCLQYMVAVALINGDISADDYEDAAACDPQIDALRDRMEVAELERFSRDYCDPGKRAIGNAIQVFFKGDSKTDRVSIDYPIGHRRQRDEGIPLLLGKFERYLRGRISHKNADRLLACCSDQTRFEQTAVDTVMSQLAV